jgi:nitrite reductase/ring-hydroxylating ferredoxin subunit
MEWQQLIEVEELNGKPRVVRSGNKQLAVFHVGEEFYVIDNRCPHEGYPLAEGSVDGDCVLTCNWHNWKFRLDDGECVLGGDHVRRYDVRIDDGFVFADLSDPPIEEVERRILEGLQGGFKDRDFGRICREITRLKFSGIDPVIAVQRAIEWTHDRLEYGFTHAFAAAADWLALGETFPDWEQQLICLAEPIDHMAFDAQRHPEYAYPAPSATEFSTESLVNAIESEDRPLAEGLVARAVEDGRHWSDLEEAFATASLAHYQDFGHAAIYVYKTKQLIERTGECVARPTMLALCRSLCYATREDLIPEFSEYRPVFESLDLASINDQTTKQTTGLNSNQVFRASIRKALRWTQQSLETHTIEHVFDVLLETLCRNQTCYDDGFDTAYDRPVSQNVGYLAFSHGITFANAVRQLCLRHPHLWGAGLLQMACFIGRNRNFLKIEPDESAWQVDSKKTLEDVVLDTVLDHGYRHPIFSAHIVKTPVAIFEEHETASESCRVHLLSALNRLLHASFKQKHVRRLARQAIDLVQRDYPNRA